MTVEAMFFVKELRHIASGGPENMAEVTLGAAFGTYLQKLESAQGGALEDCNKDWSKYTPSGEIKMMITNPGAIDQFEIGGVYKLTFEQMK